jgi:transposase
MLPAKGSYDADWIRELAMKKEANIPPKSNCSDPICFSPCLYRTRNRVERFFNRIKHAVGCATYYDKLVGALHALTPHVASEVRRRSWAGGNQFQ